MNIAEWVMAGGMLAVIGLVIKMYTDVDHKVGRAYQRLDEIKVKADDTFTRKDVCMILHTQISKDLTEMKTDIKLLLKRGNHGTEEEK